MMKIFRTIFVGGVFILVTPNVSVAFTQTIGPGTSATITIPADVGAVTFTGYGQAGGNNAAWGSGGGLGATTAGAMAQGGGNGGGCGQGAGGAGTIGKGGDGGTVNGLYSSWGGGVGGTNFAAGTAPSGAYSSAWGGAGGAGGGYAAGGAAGPYAGAGGGSTGVYSNTNSKWILILGGGGGSGVGGCSSGTSGGGGGGGGYGGGGGGAGNSSVGGGSASGGGGGSFKNSGIVILGGSMYIPTSVLGTSIKVSSYGSMIVSWAFPTLSSPTHTSVTATTATLGAKVTSWGVPATNSGGYGICWGTVASPTTNCTAATGITARVFTQAVTGLTEGTIYYYRGYATNPTGTAYSADGTFTTPVVSGTISVTSVPSASWTILGPGTLTGSGTPQTWNFQLPGTYTITWGAVSGYTTPLSQSLTLTAGGTLTFTGAYATSGTWSYPVSCPTSCGAAQSTQLQTCSGGNGVCDGSAGSRTCSATAACPTGTWTVADCLTSCGTSYSQPYACTGGNGVCSGSAPAAVSCVLPSCLILNTAPTSPTISGPTSLTPGTLGTYSFTATDAQGDQISYAIDWDGNGTTDIWMPAGVAVPTPMTYVTSGTSQSVAHSWATAGTYTIKALAQDAPGINSAWTPYAVVVSDAAPVVCGPGLAYISGFCVACTNGGCTGGGGSASSPIGTLTCSNGTYNPYLCNACGAGQTLVGGSCVNNCTNGATNPLACDICPAGQALNASNVCAVPAAGAGTCGNNICEAGETFASCPTDCPMTVQTF